MTRLERQKKSFRDAVIFNPKVQATHACILWPDKDRGKDVESAPWYKLFKGDRINDHHLSLKEKKAAREVSKT